MPVETVENNRSILTQLKLKSVLIYYLDAGAMTGKRAIRRTRYSIIKLRARPLTLMKKTDQNFLVSYVHQTALHQMLEFKMIQWESPQGHWCKYGITTMLFFGVPPFIFWFSWRVSFWIEENKSTRNQKRLGLCCSFSPFVACLMAISTRYNLYNSVFIILVCAQWALVSPLSWSYISKCFNKWS